MENITFLFLAYAAIWTGLFLFMLIIGRRLSTLHKQVERLQKELKPSSPQKAQ